MLIEAPKLVYQPDVVIPSQDVPHPCWLAWRRSGIGGSDVAKILGVCPFGTRRDLFYDKKGIAGAEDEEANKWQKRLGHVLEDEVAAMFSDVTGYRIFKIPYMFRSPEHPFMLADLDFFCVLPDGSISILECKTTSPDATGKWWVGKTPIIPLNYRYQGMHYMAVMKIDRVFFACLHGNSESYLIIRELERDLTIESELIFLEADFWQGNVLANIPPPYLEAGHLCEESVRRHHGHADSEQSPVVLPEEVATLVPRFIMMQQAKNEHARRMDSELKRMKAIITDCMGKSCNATCVVNGQEYSISFNPLVKPKIAKANLEVLQNKLPEVYEEYVTYSEERRFYIKPVLDRAA